MRHRLALATLLCWSCGGSCSVAELIGFDGRAERDYARAPEQWQTAPVGSSFKMGDAVRTRDTSRAELKLSGGGTLKLGPSTAVRFVSEAPGGADVRVESGEAEIEAGGDAINVFTAAGRARVAERGRLKVERDANGQTRFSVVVGTAVIEDDEGPAALQSGASLLLPRRSPPSASPAPSPTEVPPRPVVETSTPAPALNVEAGGRITIHGHGVALELRFAEACPGEADVILRAKGGGELLRLRGKGSVRFSLPPLAERYEVVCEDGKIALIVLRDRASHCACAEGTADSGSLSAAPQHRSRLRCRVSMVLHRHQEPRERLGLAGDRDQADLPALPPRSEHPAGRRRSA